MQIDDNDNDNDEKMNSGKVLRILGHLGAGSGQGHLGHRHAHGPGTTGTKDRTRNMWEQRPVY